MGRPPGIDGKRGLTTASRKRDKAVLPAIHTERPATQPPLTAFPRVAGSRTGLQTETAASRLLLAKGSIRRQKESVHRLKNVDYRIPIGRADDEPFFGALAEPRDKPSARFPAGDQVLLEELQPVKRAEERFGNGNATRAVDLEAETGAAVHAPTTRLVARNLLATSGVEEAPADKLV